jgi:peptidoglycan/LPS O-acetylase OafA/YrhL
MHRALAPNAAFKTTTFFLSLNGVRAICALIVVKEHSGWHLPFARILEWGFLGIDMFFGAAARLTWARSATGSPCTTRS